MYVKKVKRKCSVRGCRNTHNVFSISKTKEMGNSIIMCVDCMQDAISSTNGYKEPEKVKSEQKPLFPHPELTVTVPSVAENEPEPTEVIEEATEDIHISVAEDTVTAPKKKTNSKKR
jgi:hypothetical protein